ncbi:hypothetical protein AB4331_16395 [Vibrio breoganii]
MSRSATLGILVLFFGLTISMYQGELFRIIINNTNVTNIVIFILLSFIGVFFFYIIMGFDSDGFSVISRASSTDIGEQADIRGYTRLVNFPQYLITGSGQGYDDRFGSHQEIHSTWVAFIFYYGLPGVTLFLFFLRSIFQGKTIGSIISLSGPLIYGFTTYGARTPIFWMYLVFVFYSLHSFKSSVDEL